MNSTICLYFTTDSSPLKKPILVINAEKERLITNFVVLTEINKDYAPSGKSLLSVNITGESNLPDNEIITRVRTELFNWFGTDINNWSFLKMYRIKNAQPKQNPLKTVIREVKIRDGLFICGDHRETATFQGAMESGKKVVQQILQELGN